MWAEIGDRLTEENVAFKRADRGLFVQEWELVEGAIVKRSIKEMKQYVCQIWHLKMVPIAESEETI